MKFETFLSPSDVDDTAALQRAFDRLAESPFDRQLLLPERPLQLSGCVSLVGANRVRVAGGDLRDGDLMLIGCYDCEFDDLRVQTVAPRGGAGVRVDTLAGHATGKCTFNNLRIDGPYASSVMLIDTYGHGNNDFHVFNNFEAYGYTDSALLIGSSQSVGHRLNNVYFWGGGKYGIESYGAFSVNGRMSGNTIADVCQRSINSVAGPIAIRDLVSEGSARLYVNYRPPSTTAQVAGVPVLFDSIRFSLDAAACDASCEYDGSDMQIGVQPTGSRVGMAMPIYAGFAGPYTMTNCWFGIGDDVAAGVSRVFLRVAGVFATQGYGGAANGCYFTTDNPAAPLMDRGTISNCRAYVPGATNPYAWLPDRAF